MPIQPQEPVLLLPVKPYHTNQSFGNNIPCVKNFNQPNESIVDGADNNTCPVGYTKLYAAFGMKGHNGTDLEAGIQNVYAADDGIVIEKQIDAQLGLGLGIVSNQQYDLGTNGVHYLKLRYWHLKSFNCEIGDKITKGDWIGVSDNTGYSSGNHLHFEGDPMNINQSTQKYIVAFPDNGYEGAIDISPYFSTQFAQDIALQTAASNVQQLQTILANHPNPMQLTLVQEILQGIEKLVSSL